MTHFSLYPRLLRVLIAVAFGVMISGIVRADDASDCADQAGTFMVGTVTSGPTFKPGQIRAKRGLKAELSHTHFRFTKDGETSGATYDVAVDNVFASGYDRAPHRVPVPLSGVKVGDKIEMCGQEYDDHSGIHFVHTNCGDKPTSAEPDGWFKLISSGNTIGPNLENNQEYCPLWP